MENWRPIKDWAEIYEVSDLGRVRRIAEGHSTYPGRILAISSYNRDGYPFVRLRYKRRTAKIAVHKLVAQAFLGDRPGNHEINHKDGNPANPAALNLEYVTASRNQLHSYRELGRKPSPRYGEKNNAKLDAAKVRRIKRLYERGNFTQAQIADHFGVTQPLISAIILGKLWTKRPPQSCKNR